MRAIVGDMPTALRNHEHRPTESAILARAELARIERQIGSGSARNGAGRWSAVRARRLNRLRYREAVCKARALTLEEAVA